MHEGWPSLSVTGLVTHLTPAFDTSTGSNVSCLGMHSFLLTLCQREQQGQLQDLLSQNGMDIMSISLLPAFVSRSKFGASPLLLLMTAAANHSEGSNQQGGRGSVQQLMSVQVPCGTS